MPTSELHDQLIKYLEDVHALEQNAITMLKTAVDEAGEPQLKDAFSHHLTETEEHEGLIATRLQALGASPSRVKDFAQRGAAVLGGAIAKATPDTTGKLAIQAYAFEHVEIASYRMLRVAAQAAGDAETALVAEQILEQEREAASKLDGLIEPVARYDLGHLVAA